MENRFQYLLLNRVFSFLITCVLGLACVSHADNASQRGKKINSEFLDAGLTFGIIDIQDFTSEFVIGVNASFKATEDFFLQFNYVQTDVGLASFEKSQGPYFDGDDRTFSHYDVLVGYNVFQGEFFLFGSDAQLSTVYLVGGVGDTNFGGESAFSFTLGAGYQLAINRKFIVRVDYRDYVYDSVLLQEDQATHNIQLSTSISYLF